MMNKAKVVLGLLTVILILSVIGCGSSTKIQTSDLDLLREQLAEKETEIKDLKSEVTTTSSVLEVTKSKLTETEAELEKAKLVVPENKTVSVSSVGSEMLPPGAKTGECYARTFTPPTYKTVVDTMLKAEASERVEIIPARYEMVEERILVKEEGKRFDEVPAKYEWVEEKVLVREAHKEWKKGRGLVEKLDDGTGEIMCLVEVPAQYNTVRKKVQTQPAGVKEVVIPAEYDTVKVRKMVSPPQEKRIAIPAEYQYLKHTVQVTDGHMEWRRVLCETNMTRDMGTKIQRALNDAGHNAGPVDGVIGPLTHSAIKSYQKAHNLATGGLTYETIASLGVK